MTLTSIEMRPSRVLEKMRLGEIASCIKLNTSDSRVAEIAARCGFDCIWVDMEHTANTLRDIENQIRAAKMHDVDALVRVTRGCYSDLIRPLEMDAAGIMVPHVVSCADAKEIARQTRFYPIGRRALDGGNSDGAYCMIPIEQYIEQANQHRFVIVQIEDPEPMVELDDIAAVEGVDMLFFGRLDFSHGLGIPKQFGDPRIEEARCNVAAAARRHGKYAGIVTNVQDVVRVRDMGYQFISLGADVCGLSSYFLDILSSLKSVLDGSSSPSDLDRLKH